MIISFKDLCFNLLSSNGITILWIFDFGYFVVCFLRLTFNLKIVFSTSLLKNTKLLIKQQFVVSGSNYARVKVLLDEQGKQTSKCLPSKVVCIGGWKVKGESVDSGQPIVQVKNEVSLL